MKTILFFCTELLQCLRDETFFSVKAISLLRRVQRETVFKTQRKSSVFKEMLLTEINEVNIGHLHYLFSCF